MVKQVNGGVYVPVNCIVLVPNPGLVYSMVLGDSNAVIASLFIATIIVCGSSVLVLVP